jgi:hypothetical protein
VLGIEWLDARLTARLDETFGQERAGIYPKRIQKYYIRQFTLLPTK